MKTALFLACFIVCGSISVGQPICDFQAIDSLVVDVVGDTVNIWDLLACGNCASIFSISVSRSADSIYITQTDTAQEMATCDCIFNLRTSIVGLPAGTYSVVIYRDWRAKYHDSTHGFMFVGAIRFQYNPQTPGSLSLASFQSGCLSSSVPNETPHAPTQFVLLPNFPNPFNPNTTVQFRISQSAHVVIKVFDILGREVQTLLSEERMPGLHSLTFEAAPELGSGIYCCRMIVGSYSHAITMVLVR